MLQRFQLFIVDFGTNPPPIKWYQHAEKRFNVLLIPSISPFPGIAFSDRFRLKQWTRPFRSRLKQIKKPLVHVARLPIYAAPPSINWALPSHGLHYGNLHWVCSNICSYLMNFRESFTNRQLFPSPAHNESINTLFHSSIFHTIKKI